ncbi:hypothetical protein CERSUDRAFT_137870 [Gelatoporia subvermispora B]|uniref:AB hydrolase-1 domain-containing protein n=1 Tax=Ceriporiopsis subvermispora (strain B) TaxID=914234 RepID=M2QGR4_CERS8|nr:hypothetical protein CERSUDRAFT_137870 [Gelatoporia subvermispora B]
MHILEAGDPSAPLLLLLHGFPELAFSWRQVIIPLAAAGFHVVAPDHRGYGRTTSRDSATPVPVQYEDDLRPYTLLSAARDVVALAFALGYRTAAAVVGHDYGSAVAAYAALIRPDVFLSVVLMSAPYPGPPPLPFAIDNSTSMPTSGPTMPFPNADGALAALNPPRKHYATYYSGPGANAEMLHAPQGLRAFLRGYFHMKSGDWAGNDPHPLTVGDPASLAELPWYYVMPLDSTMADVAQSGAPDEDQARECKWLTEEELGVFENEYARTGFQGGLNRYRCRTDPAWMAELSVFSGRKIEVSAMYLAGTKDWNLYQNPGALQKMREECAGMDEEDVVLIHGAGHWAQQERPEEVVHEIVRFLKKVRSV